MLLSAFAECVDATLFPMLSPGNPVRDRSSRLNGVSKMSSVCSLGILLLAGCASQGPLRPPSLHLPGVVQGIAASRTGDAVDLRWTNPGRTIDGLPLTGKHVPAPLTVEICRDEEPHTVCTPVAHLAATVAGTAAYRDVLPVLLAIGPVRPLVYRIRVLNGIGRGTTATPVQTLAGAAPLPLHGLAAEPVAGGVALHWQADAAAGGRILIRVNRGEGLEGGQGKPAARQQRGALLAVESAHGDPGGALDTGAQTRTAQSYAVSRVRMLHVGAEELTISSAAALVNVSADAEAAPPPAPSGLQALADTLGQPEIDVSWEPVAHASAYRIYRAEGNGPLALVTTDVLSGLSYRDRAVRPGRRYRYSVASVDGQGRTGAQSGEVVESIPQP